MQINKSLYPVGTNFRAISEMQDNMARLQLQLSSGQKASTLSEVGRDRVFDLSIRARSAKVESFQSSISIIGLRLDFLDNSLTRLSDIVTESRSAVSSAGSGSNGVNQVSAQSLASARLEEVLTILNGDINGRHVFGGSKTDAEPVGQYQLVMDGDSTRAGFKTIAAQRKAADAGLDGKGRLITDIAQLTSAIPGGTPDTVTLTEDDPVLHPYGPKLTGVSTTSGSVSVTAPTGTPAALSVQFTGLPTAGDTVTIDVTLPDGTTESRVMTAVSGPPANPGEFEIGATPDATAINFQQTLDQVMTPDTVTLAEDGVHPFGLKLTTVTSTSGAVSSFAPTGSPKMTALRVSANPTPGDVTEIRFDLADGTSGSLKLKAVTGTPVAPDEYQIGADPKQTAQNLKATLDSSLQNFVSTTGAVASTCKAADDFFNGQGQTVMRVDGPPYETATAMIAASATDTVFWYNGSDTGVARQSVTNRVDENTTVTYGVQANENGILRLVRSLAAVAEESFSSSDPTSTARYQAMSSRQLERLSSTHDSEQGSLKVIGLELGVARATADQANERHKFYSTQLEGMLGEIEQAPIEETSLKLVQLKTRLEASFQATSMVSQLTLVNYLR